MKKPKLFFAFGAHPGSDPKKDPGERVFFSAAIKSAINSANKEGRKIAVIAEYKYWVNPNDYFSPRGSSVLERLSAEINGVISNRESANVRYGIHPEIEWLDWGYLDSIIALNLQRAGTVDLELERSSPRILGTTPFEMGYGTNGRLIEDGLKRETSIVTHAIISSHLRTRELIARVREIRLPNTAIFIPRGFAHKNMIVKFDGDYDVECIGGSSCVPRIQSEAIIFSYKRRLTSEEIEAYARAKIICNRLEREELAEKKKTLVREKGADVAYREVLKEAKKLTREILFRDYNLSLPALE